MAQGENPLRLSGLNLSITSDDSRAINFDKAPKVILSASGMCEAGRIRHHLKHNLWQEKSTILFVGYQSEGTVGRKIIDGEPYVKLFGEEVRVRAHIETLEGISGHADRDMLLSWLERLPAKPRRVFVNHGGDEVCDHFVDSVKQTLGLDAVAPYVGGLYDLESGVCLEQGNTARIVKKPTTFGRANAAASAVYQRLLAAGRRLLTVIEHNRGGANKDLAKFADQVTELCNKWDR